MKVTVIGASGNAGSRMLKKQPARAQQVTAFAMVAEPARLRRQGSTAGH